MIHDLWYKDSVIYSLDVETFMDGDGDGVGDFKGLMRRLDYLQYLGVDAVWLGPFQPTPNRDNGYDISDYYGVDPRHGSGGDFVEFVHRASDRGIRVIMDLVVNHTSDEHPWFQKSRSDPESPYRDWYLWFDERPEDWDEGMIFPGVQEKTWTYDREAGAYYFHRFHDFQPDLNIDNPQVREEIHRIMGFWLQLGVAGFRIDAVPFLLESTVPGEKRKDLRTEYMAEFRDFVEWRSGDAVMLGEANVEPEEMGPFFEPHGDEGLHMMFNFWVNQRLFHALASERAEPLAEAIEDTKGIPAFVQWANFLRNHDELDLGRLSDEARDLVFSKFGPEEEMRIFGRGIRRRLAPMLGSRRREELAYSLMFALPGTPVIRYGDELRMGDDLDLPHRQAIRTPMQWSEKPNGGFSASDETVQPVIDEGTWSFEHVNVAAQRRDPDSFLNWMASLIRMRKQCPEIGWGECRILESGDPHVLALRYDWRGGAIVVLHNLADEPFEVELELGDDDARPLANLLDEEDLHPRTGGRYVIALEALDYRWYRVGGLDYTGLWQHRMSEPEESEEPDGRAERRSPGPE